MHPAFVYSQSGMFWSLLLPLFSILRCQVLQPREKRLRPSTNRNPWRRRAKEGPPQSWLEGQRRERRPKQGRTGRAPCWYCHPQIGRRKERAKGQMLPTSDPTQGLRRTPKSATNDGRLAKKEKRETREKKEGAGLVVAMISLKKSELR